MSDPVIGARRPLAAPLLVIAFGLVLCAIALVKGGLNFLYDLDGKAIVGTVVYSDYARDSRGIPQGNITYRFSLGDGRTFQGHQTGYSLSPGQTIRLQYLAHHPAINRVAGAQRAERKWLLPVGVIGMLFLLAGLRALALARRQELRRPI